MAPNDSKNLTSTLLAIGYVEHYRQERVVVKLDDDIVYQAGENLDQQKEQLVDGCRIIITKIPINDSTKRTFSVCKVVQREQETKCSQSAGCQSGETLGTKM